VPTDRLIVIAPRRKPTASSLPVFAKHLAEPKILPQTIYEADVRWHIETLPLAQVNEGLERLRRGDVLGRLVVVP